MMEQDSPNTEAVSTISSSSDEALYDKKEALFLKKGTSPAHHHHAKGETKKNGELSSSGDEDESGNSVAIQSVPSSSSASSSGPIPIATSSQQLRQKAISHVAIGEPATHHLRAQPGPMVPTSMAPTSAIPKANMAPMHHHQYPPNMMPQPVGHGIHYYNPFHNNYPMANPPTVHYYSMPPPMPSEPQAYPPPPTTSVMKPSTSSVVEFSDSDSGSSTEEEEEDYIVTHQKPSPYTDLKKKHGKLERKYQRLAVKYNALLTEVNTKKRRRHDNFFQTIDESTAAIVPDTYLNKNPFPTGAINPSKKRKDINRAPSSESLQESSPKPMLVSNNAFPPVSLAPPLEGSASSSTDNTFTLSFPPISAQVDPSSSKPIALNKLARIYYYDGGWDGHGARQLKANGKRIFIDIDWNEIGRVRKVDTCLHMCIFVNTSTVDKVRDSDLIAIFKIIRTDGERVKISKIRENLRKLNNQNQFSNIGHIKFFVQIRGQDKVFDYTDKILLYSKTQHNIANFEPNNQKEYTELSKLFYQPERFTVFKKV